jgi:methionyl-tRNA formyltransferase
MAKLRIVFFGTPDLACAILQTLLDGPSFDVVTVVTQPDRPKGRDLKLRPSAVKELATRRGLPILHPARARDDAFALELRACQPDLIVVAAYGQILPQGILDLPRFGCLNVHTSLLPKYRGAAPIQWAILNGETETGATIMRMDAGLDTGDIVAQETLLIRPEDTSETLHDRLAKAGAELLARTIPVYIAGQIRLQPQPATGVTYAPRIKKQDGQIDWAQPARSILNRLRALTPWPGAFAHLPGQPPLLLKIWQAEVVEAAGPPGEVLRADKAAGIVVACGQGALRVVGLQREGGRRLSAQEFLAGHALMPGQRLG